MISKIPVIFVLRIIIILLFSTTTNAEVIYVDSQSTFDDAHDNASMNDSIIWRAGIYEDIFMDIEKDHLYILAESLGNVIFTDASRVDISADFITLKGFQFINGDIGTKDVINTTGSNLILTQINIRAYTSYKYLRVREASQYVTISYCNFENRLNLDDQNILSILVDGAQPGYHKIQYCSFKNFDGTGNDLGIEPIRIGLSTQADRISRTVVEYCYFTQCNGDGELISSKASQNVYRYNTFENNPKAELVLRHGSEAIVYGNFFLNGKGGVRIREGQNHYIYNNYFYELDDRAIYVQNESSDPLDNINIAFNTIVSCSEVILGGDGSFKPTNVTFANNIFSDPDDKLFEEATGTETWISNISSGNLGIALPSSGMEIIDPMLTPNSQGFFNLDENSPAINAASGGYAPLPIFEGIENIDAEILFDLMGQNRPMSVSEKDVGCNEYPHNILIQPIATEANTGPDYNTSVISATQNSTRIVVDMIELNPNPVSTQLNITILNKRVNSLFLEIVNFEGKIIKAIDTIENSSNNELLTIDVSNLPAGVYVLHASASVGRKGINKIQSIKFIKSE